LRKDLGNGERERCGSLFSYIVLMFIKPFPFLLLFRKIAAIQTYAENTLLE
jgi:hypothetical protein